MTSSLGLPETGMTPAIAEGNLKKESRSLRDVSEDPAAGLRPDKFVVRIPKSQTTVLLKLNTKLLAEQREIEHLNEEIRRAGW
ncbi:MAG: hypothetical protein U0790_27670 [Isosphaeraceae bacterium]